MSDHKETQDSQDLPETLVQPVPLDHKVQQVHKGQPEVQETQVP